MFKRTASVILLTCVSAYVLLIFLRPSPRHIGINQYESALFLDMVNGTAHKPYVSRVLLPIIVRGLAASAPESVHAFFRAQVAESADLRFLFRVFEWEPNAALQYWIASVAMLFALIGFGHVGAKLILLTCPIQDRRGGAYIAFALLSLLLLLPFFKYASYIYDPPQLALFTAALYFLKQERLRPFAVSFVLSCFNKETAVLLIPIFALMQQHQLPAGRYYGALAALTGVFAASRIALALAFRDNPGAMAELHLFDHNLPWLFGQASATNLIVAAGLTFLLLYRFREKDRFLRIAFACTFPVLFLLTLFLGYIDEWRDYYEAYPAGFALVVDSVRRLILRGMPSQPPPERRRSPARERRRARDSQRR